MAEDLPISVVVATRDRPRLLAGCLDSLAGALCGDDELVVVDSCSGDDTSLTLARDHAARALRMGVPGASRARNAGWRAARHDIVAFVDDDVRVHRGWAGALRAVLRGDESVGFVTGRLGPEPGGPEVERPVALLDRATSCPLTRSTVRDLGHGANLAVRRGALEDVGGFDERFGPGAHWSAAEDLDLLDRLLGAGHVGRYEPSVDAWHVQWRTRRHLLPLEWSYGTGQGARLARLWSDDPARARAVVRTTAWDDGLRDLARCVRDHYEFGALMAGVRLAGTARGALSFAAGRAVRGRFHDATSPRCGTDPGPAVGAGERGSRRAVTAAS